jgi:PAS domain S-box-containing protein
MNWLQRISIHNKLALALWGAALLAFVVTGVALALFGRFTLEGRARQIMEPYAHLVAIGVETAVAFEDPGRAREILATLRANPQILGAEIVLRDGRLLADYHTGSKAAFHPFKTDGVYLYDNNAELQQRLQDDAHLRLVMNLDEFNRQTKNVLQLVGAGVLVLLVAITLGLRAALHRVIAFPIATLSETVEQVRTLADYHRRVAASGDDEVARLGRSFNAMMEAIQEREDDLRQLTLFQRTILDNVAYGIIATAPDGIVSSFNPAAERLLGYTAREVTGTQTPALWHDSAEMAQRALQLSGELGQTITPGFEVFAARPRRNLPEEREWTFIRKDGTRVPVLLSITSLRGENGQITGFVGLTYDLTERTRAEEERRESESKYRRIVDTAIEGICSLGPDGMTTFVNARMAEMVGYAGPEMIGRPLTDFMFEEDVPDHLKKMENRRRGLSESYERRFRRKNGETVWTLASATPVFDADRTFQGSFAMFTDITERLLAEEELRRLKDELEQRVQERTAELAAKNEELYKMNRLFVGRELRMMELKERIREFEK